jgi:mannonate dehydratase
MVKHTLNRRSFLESNAAGCLAGLGIVTGATGSSSPSMAADAGTRSHSIKLGVSHIKIAEFDERHVTFLRQMGIEHIEGWVTEPNSSYDDLVTIRQRVEDAGFRIYHCGHLDYYNSESFHLNLAGREEKLRRYERFIKDLGRAGIHNTIYAWTPGGVYSTGRVRCRGCDTRMFDLSQALKRPNAYDRVYQEEEVWDNYAYFIKRMLPVAEDAGVRLALHPCDPPATLCGAARIFSSTEAMKRAMEIAEHSPYSGVQFCVGTWGEMPGPEGKGEDVVEAIRHFGRAGRIVAVHFRNVSAPLPRFHETFVDNGYLDMGQVMAALVEVGFDGLAVPDHVPSFQDEPRIGPMGVSGTPYSLGFMRGLLNRLRA